MPYKKGRVYLIGAGPGDPDLITLKGIECIRNAEVIVYDFLANEELLKYADVNAEKIYVGKIGGKEDSKSQDEINNLIIIKAKEGKIVVRLKGGDPFIFGRGGEEAEVLSKAGITFDIIPGITSAISVPAYAGIPLTHRKYSSTVAFITGHEDPSRKFSQIEWDKISTGISTLVFLMGIKNLKHIVDNLIKNGRNKETPVAIIRRGTTAEQETIIGNLSNIVEIAHKRNIKAPAITIVGEVVRLRERLNWFEKKPLFGKRVLITRTREQAGRLSRLLREYGAEPVEIPTIEIKPPETYKHLDKSIKNIHTYSYIIFTSVNGVISFFDRLYLAGIDIRDLRGIKVCAIGSETEREILKRGIRVDIMPGEFTAEGVIKKLKVQDIKGKRVLIPRAEKAREIIPEELTNLGAGVDVVEAYKTELPKNTNRLIEVFKKNKKIDIFIFTSSSTVKNFVNMLKYKNLKEVIKDSVVACIGPITSETAKEYGIETHIMPSVYTIPALVDEIVRYYDKR